MAKVKICSTCGMEFIAKRKDQVYCSKECKGVISAKIKKKKPPHKVKQSVSEILKIGRAHGIYSYGKIVQAIERGEIE